MEKCSILGVAVLWVIALFILDNYVVESIVAHIVNRRLRFTIKCSEQSEFLQAYNSFQLQQQLLN